MLQTLWSHIWGELRPDQEWLTGSSWVPWTMWSSICAILAWSDWQPWLGWTIPLGYASWPWPSALPFQSRCKIRQSCWFRLVKLFGWSSWSLGHNGLLLSEDWSSASRIWYSLMQQFRQRSPWLGWQYMSPLARGCHHNSWTHMLRWWFVVLSHRRRIIPRSYQSQVLLTHSPYSFSLLLSTFLFWIGFR